MRSLPDSPIVLPLVAQPSQYPRQVVVLDGDESVHPFPGHLDDSHGSPISDLRRISAAEPAARDPIARPVNAPRRRRREPVKISSSDDSDGLSDVVILREKRSGATKLPFSRVHSATVGPVESTREAAGDALDDGGACSEDGEGTFDDHEDHAAEPQISACDDEDEEAAGSSIDEDGQDFVKRATGADRHIEKGNSPTRPSARRTSLLSGLVKTEDHRFIQTPKKQLKRPTTYGIRSNLMPPPAAPRKLKHAPVTRSEPTRRKVQQEADPSPNKMRSTPTRSKHVAQLGEGSDEETALAVGGPRGGRRKRLVQSDDDEEHEQTPQGRQHPHRPITRYSKSTAAKSARSVIQHSTEKLKDNQRLSSPNKQDILEVEIPDDHSGDDTQEEDGDTPSASRSSAGSRPASRIDSAIPEDVDLNSAQGVDGREIVSSDSDDSQENSSGETVDSYPDLFDNNETPPSPTQTQARRYVVTQKNEWSDKELGCTPAAAGTTSKRARKRRSSKQLGDVWQRTPGAAQIAREAAKAERKAARKAIKQKEADAHGAEEKIRVQAEWDADREARAQALRRQQKGRPIILSPDEDKAEQGSAAGTDWTAFRPGRGDNPRQARGRIWPKGEYDPFNDDDNDNWALGDEGQYNKMRRGIPVGAKPLRELPDPGQAIQPDASYWATRDEMRKEENRNKRRRRRREHSPYDGVAIQLEMSDLHSAAGRSEQWAKKVEKITPSRRFPQAARVHKPRQVAPHLPIRKIDSIKWAEYNARYDAGREFPVDTTLFCATVDGEKRALLEHRAKRKTVRAKKKYLRQPEILPSMTSLDELIDTVPPTQYTHSGVGGRSRGTGATDFDDKAHADGIIRRPPRPPKLHFVSREPTPGRIVAGTRSKPSCGPKVGLTFTSNSVRAPPLSDPADVEDDIMQPGDEEELEYVPAPPMLVSDRVAERRAKSATKQTPKAQQRLLVHRPAEEEEDDFFDDIIVPEASLPAAAPTENTSGDTNVKKARIATHAGATESSEPKLPSTAITPKVHMMNGLHMTETMLNRLQHAKELFNEIEMKSAAESSGGGVAGTSESERSRKRPKRPSAKKGISGAEVATNQDAVNTLDGWLNSAVNDPSTEALHPAVTRPARTPSSKRRRTLDLHDPLVDIAKDLKQTDKSYASYTQMIREEGPIVGDGDDLAGAASPWVQVMTQPSSPIRQQRGHSPTQRRAPSIPSTNAVAPRLGLSRSQTRTTLLRRAPTLAGGGPSAMRQRSTVMLDKSYAIMPGQQLSSPLAPTHVSATIGAEEDGEDEEDSLFTSTRTAGDDFPTSAMSDYAGPGSRTGPSRKSSRTTRSGDVSTTQRNTESGPYGLDDGDNLQDVQYNDNDDHVRMMYDHGYAEDDMQDNHQDQQQPNDRYALQETNMRYDRMYPHQETHTGTSAFPTNVPVSRQLGRRPNRQPVGSVDPRDTETVQQNSRSSASARRAPAGPSNASRADKPVMALDQDHHQFPPIPPMSPTEGDSGLKITAVPAAFHTTVAPAPTTIRRKLGKSKSNFVPPKPLSTDQAPRRQAAAAGPTTTGSSRKAERAAPRRMGSCSEKAAAPYKPLTMSGQAC